MLLASGSQDNYIRVWCISLRDNLLVEEDDAVTDELKLKEDSFTITARGMFICPNDWQHERNLKISNV